MTTPTRHLQQSRTGPWGTLEYFFLYLDPPSHLFSDSHLSTVTEWAFPDLTRGEVERFCQDAGLALDSVRKRAAWIPAANGMLLRPDRDLLFSLTAEQRQEFYPRLIRLSDQRSHLNSFVVDRGCFRENAAGLGVPEELVSLIETRCVTMGGKTIFAETAFALSLTDSQDTRLAILKALSRARSLIARLKIEPGMDPAEVARWWTAGPNRSRALPLFESALRMRGVDSIDLIHLLPPVPRRLLNSYPDPRDTLNGNSPDCYWAAMNFFSETASSRYLDNSLPRQYYFLERFDQVNAPRQFGDVIVIAQPERNRFVHAYIHIADDIVYTKNGTGRFFPFILMRESDLLSHYLEGDDMVTEIFRYRSVR